MLLADLSPLSPAFEFIENRYFSPRVLKDINIKSLVDVFIDWEHI